MVVLRFQDGHDYFQSCKAAIEGAERSIYITDWILSAEVLLGRPSPEELEAEGRSLDPEGEDKPITLAALLHKKASEDDVQVRVLIFNELAISLPNNSKYAASKLLTHPNIRVLRHPEGITLWSHHEKLCIIDQEVAYIGGIDLAFGRFDTHQHPIKDDEKRFVPGKDLYNPRIAGLEKLEEPHDDLFDRQRMPRMPWHDIAFCVSGAAANDAAAHFIQRWNNHEKEQGVAQSTKESGEHHALLREYGHTKHSHHENDCCYISSDFVKCCGNWLTVTRDQLFCCQRSTEITHNEVLLLEGRPYPKPIPGMQASQSHQVTAQVWSDVLQRLPGI